MPKLIDIWPMMKEKKLGEHVLGSEALESDNLAIIYGRLQDRETDRHLFCPTGKVAFFYVVEGAIRVSHARQTWTMVEGEAIKLIPENDCTLINPRNRPSLYLLITADCK